MCSGGAAARQVCTRRGDCYMNDSAGLNTRLRARPLGHFFSLAEIACSCLGPVLQSACFLRFMMTLPAWRTSSMSDDKPRSGLSRRAFLRGSGMAAAATAVTGVPVLTPPAEAAPPQPAAGGPNVPAHGPGPVKITLNVNGREMGTSVEPRVTLLDALRNQLDVTGCKRVCDRGTCGACTVMLDGKTRSEERRVGK